MNDKEFNLGILNKLYEIAKEVFSTHVRVPEGSYTAADLSKLGTSIFEEGYLQTEEKQVTENIGTSMEQTINKTCFVAPLAAVEYLTFQCSFCIATLFTLVAKFEKLAGIGSKRYIFVKANECAKVISKVTVEITKDLATLCDCVANDELRPIMNNVCLDIKEHKAVASDGHVLQVKYFAVVDKSEYVDTEQYQPLIPGKEFKKMCSLAGKSGANMDITLVEESEGVITKEYWICECKGITSKVEKERYPNYHSVIPKINTHNIVSLSDVAWKAAKKWLKTNKNFNEFSHLVKIKHEEGSDEIKFIMENIDFGKEVHYSVCCAGVPYEKFAFGLSAVSMLKVITGDFCIAIPDCASKPVAYLGSMEYGMLMPMLFNDDDDQWTLPAGTTDPMCFCEFPTKEQCEVLDSENECANRIAERIETAKVVSNTSEQESEPQSAKETENIEPAKEVTKSVTAADTSTATKKAAGTTKEQRKFSFDKIGVQAGDVLTFVDGTEVTATADGKVEFCGEVFTLSGFTKEFIPKKTKSGAYRGCAFFYKDGVKLEKLFKQYLATLDSREEEVTLDSAPDEVAADTTDTSKEEVTELEQVSIPECKDDTLDGTATEPQKCALVRLEVESEVIAPPSEETAADGRGEPPRAKVVYLGIGTLAKVVNVSLVGMTDRATEPPPNMLGGEKVVNHPYMWAAGNYSLTAGKVVHELPLPPPKQNKIWIQKKHYYSQRHSNTSKVLAHSPPALHCSVHCI